MAKTDKQLAQIATGIARQAGGDREEMKRLLFSSGLTKSEMERALFYLESNRPLLGR